MDFSEKFLKARHNLHYTQEEMAEAMNVSKTTVCRWESGAHYPPAHKREKILNRLEELGAFGAGAKVVKINTHGNPLPEKHGEWYDLSTSEDVYLDEGDMAVISLGVSVKPPEGYYFLVASRSSTPLKYGLNIANGIGIIESTYCGDDDVLGLVVYATKDIFIDKGTRIAQMTLVKKSPEIVFQQVESMGEENRGGYGSTGV